MPIEKLVRQHDFSIYSNMDENFNILVSYSYIPTMSIGFVKYKKNNYFNKNERLRAQFYPRATSSIIIITNPAAAPIVPICV